MMVKVEGNSRQTFPSANELPTKGMSTATKPRPVPSPAVNSPSTRILTSHPEFDLLLACCASASGHTPDHRISQLVSLQLNWDRWLGLVDHHRVVPQAYRALVGLRESLPDETFLALRSRYQDNARKALWFTGELVRIVGHLESRGIKTLVYKGPVLAEILYGEVTQRQFGDLDVLIRAADVPKASAALLDLEYKSGLELTPRQRRNYIDSGYELACRNPHGQNLLELQWQILPRFYSVDFDVAGFFARATEVRVGGRPFHTLSTPDLLLVLSVHAAKHLWEQLSWLCDIGQLATFPQLDWNAIRDESRRLGIERILYLNLLLASKLLGSLLPPFIQAQDKTTTILTDEIQRVIERSEHYDTESVPYFRLMMRLRERRRDRARFFSHLAFTPGTGEWSAVRLPDGLSPLYRLVRFSRLAKRLTYPT